MSGRGEGETRKRVLGDREQARNMWWEIVASDWGRGWGRLRPYNVCGLSRAFSSRMHSAGESSRLDSAKVTASLAASAFHMLLAQGVALQEVPALRSREQLWVFTGHHILATSH